MDSTQKNLIKNIESQIERLQAQLNEIEEEKDELDADEYQEMKDETTAELKEFQEKLAKFKGKDLRSDSEKAQQEMQKSVSAAYNQDKIKERISEEKALKIREKIKELAVDSNETAAMEILKLIQEMQVLECTLTKDEEEFLKQFDGDFEKVKNGNGESLLQRLAK